MKIISFLFAVVYLFDLYFCCLHLGGILKYILFQLTLTATKSNQHQLQLPSVIPQVGSEEGRVYTDLIPCPEKVERLFSIDSLLKEDENNRG